MPLSPGQQTAKIYQFPVKPRPPEAVDRLDPRRPVSWEPPVTSSDFGSGWYHEAAMQESQQDRKH